MKNYIQAGDNITVAAPADVESGALVVVGALHGAATGSAKSGDPVTIVRKGVFEFAKLSEQAWSVGAKVYFDGALCTTVASGNALVGTAVADAANPSPTGLVVLI